MRASKSFYLNKGYPAPARNEGLGPTRKGPTPSKRKTPSCQFVKPTTECQTPKPKPTLAQTHLVALHLEYSFLPKHTESPAPRQPAQPPAEHKCRGKIEGKLTTVTTPTQACRRIPQGKLLPNASNQQLRSPKLTPDVPYRSATSSTLAGPSFPLRHSARPQTPK
ncbi:unnamed protein product [Prunus armeniaca]